MAIPGHGVGRLFMPWKEQRAMSQKMEFVERAAKGEPVATLCREFGVSRTTGHKWVKRYKERGYEGLEEHSRRPKSVPLATAEDIVVAVLEARQAHPTWGPEKLAIVLRRRFREQTPSKRTIARILSRAQLIRKRVKRRPPNVVERAPQVQAHAPNEVWTVDFKGWWRAVNRERCEPLTVRDAFSRLVLATVLCTTSTADAKSVFQQLFRKYSVPRAIQCDNGVPFVAVRSRAGLSALSAWWVSLGIRIVRSRLSCPQDNGAHERMHRDISESVQLSPATDKRQQQRQLDKWRQEFNHVRPHQALKGKTPAEVYKASKPCAAPSLPSPYPASCYVTNVHRNGCFRIMGNPYFVSRALAGYDVGLEPLDPLHVRVWFCAIDLGVIEIEPRADDAVYLQTARRTNTKVA
jgi:putative transposase